MFQDRAFQFLTAAAVLSAATVATAQTRPTQPDRDGFDKDRDKAQQRLELRRASNITGTDLHSSDNKDLGEINNLAIDPQTGKAKFVIVGAGGVLGIGETLKAVPLKAIEFGREGDVARLKVTQQQFEQAPEFEDDDWDRLGDPQMSQNIYRHYGVEMERDSDRGMRDDRPGARPGDRPGQPATAQAGATRLIKSSDAIGMTIENPQGENLGDVNDLIVNLHNGKIQYCIVGFGGVLGIGEDLVAVPWDALDYDRTQEQFLVNMDQERFRNAPSFNRNEWPTMTERRWTEEVHAYYGADANWIYAYVETDDADRRDGQRPPRDGQRPGAAGQSQGWESNSQYNRMFAQGQTRNITGTIRNIERTRPMSGMSEGVVLNVQTQDGQTMAVHLGPTWFIDNQQVRFNQGDQVTVSGAQVNVDGQPAFMASEVRINNNTMKLRDQNGHPTWDAMQTGGGQPPRPNPATPR